jgi:hypothetical protein
LNEHGDPRDRPREIAQIRDAGLLIAVALRSSKTRSTRRKVQATASNEYVGVYVLRRFRGAIEEASMSAHLTIRVGWMAIDGCRLNQRSLR